MGEVLQQAFPDFWRKISESCCELVGFEERMMGIWAPLLYCHDVRRIQHFDRNRDFMK